MSNHQKAVVLRIQLTVAEVMGFFDIYLCPCFCFNEDGPETRGNAEKQNEVDETVNPTF